MLSKYKIADKFINEDGKGGLVSAGAYGTVLLCTKTLCDNIAKVAVEAGSKYFVLITPAPAPAPAKP
jgi:hypothetical protein